MKALFSAKQFDILSQAGIVKGKEEAKIFIWQVSCEIELKEKLFALTGLTAKDFGQILQAWQKLDPNDKWKFAKNINFIRKDKYIWNKEVDIFEYCMSSILQMLVDRVIKGDKPQYREGWIDLKEMTGVPDESLAEGFYITVERPRRFAKDPQTWQGCVAVPLRQEIESLILSFVAGSFNNNVFFSEFLKGYARQLRQDNRTKEILPEVVMLVRSLAKITKLMQYDTDQLRARRGFEKARNLFDAIEFSLLFQSCRQEDRTFKHPYEVMGLTLNALDKSLGGILNDCNKDTIEQMRAILDDENFSLDSKKQFEGNKPIDAELFWGILEYLETVSPRENQYQYYIQKIYHDFIKPKIKDGRSKNLDKHVLKYDLGWFNIFDTLKLVLKNSLGRSFIISMATLSLGAAILYKFVGQSPSPLTIGFIGITLAGLVALSILKIKKVEEKVVKFIDKKSKGAKQGLHSFFFETIVEAGSKEKVEAGYNNAKNNEEKEKIHRALNNLYTYSVRPWPKFREFVIVPVAIALGYGVGFKLLGLTLLPLSIFMTGMLIFVPALLSNLLRWYYRSYSKDPYSYKKMISYPAYIFLSFYMLIAIFGLPYVECIIAAYSWFWRLPVLGAAFTLVFLVLTLAVRIPTYFAYWPMIVSQRWQIGRASCRERV